MSSAADKFLLDPGCYVVIVLSGQWNIRLYDGTSYSVHSMFFSLD